MSQESAGIPITHDLTDNVLERYAGGKVNVLRATSEAAGPEEVVTEIVLSNGKVEIRRSTQAMTVRGGQIRLIRNEELGKSLVLDISSFKEKDSPLAHEVSRNRQRLGLGGAGLRFDLAVASRLTGAGDVPLQMEDHVDDGLIRSIEEYMESGKSDFGVHTAPVDERTASAVEHIRNL